MPKRELRSGSGASRVHDVMYAWASAPGINHTLKSIEDAVAISLGQIDGQEVAMFGVYDGHAGRHVSQYLKNHLFEKVTDEPEFEKEDYEGALRRAYCEMNRVRAHASLCTLLVLNPF